MTASVEKTLGSPLKPTTNCIAIDPTKFPLLNTLAHQREPHIGTSKGGYIGTQGRQDKRKRRDGAHSLGFWMLWLRPQPQLTRKQWRSQGVVPTLWNNGGEEAVSAPKNPAPSTNFRSLVATETSLWSSNYSTSVPVAIVNLALHNLPILPPQ